MNQSVLWLFFSVFLFRFSFTIEDCSDNKTQFSLFNDTIAIKDKDELFHLSIDADSVLLSLTNDAEASSINVTLNGQIPFEDFVLEGRMSNSSTAGDVIGSFRPHLDSAHQLLLLDCPGGTRNAITLKEPVSRWTESVLWIPPKDFAGDVYFRALILWNGTWIEIQSPQVFVINGH